MVSTTKSEKRTYTFRSFAERAEDIKIDPIRRSKRRITDKDVRDDNSSYFLVALERWNDITVTPNYLEFSQTVSNISQSLPQILYHSKTIHKSLLRHLLVNERASLAPLLDLMTQLARDLSEEFDPFFGSTLKTLIVLVTDDKTEVDSLEPIFNCMAYLFKYLSRFLVQDLAPTYRVIAPLFNHQKQAKGRYINRFVAEALSFLLRKCSEDSLRSITGIILDDIKEKSTTSAKDSAVLCFSTAIKSTGAMVHSKAASMISIFLDECLNHQSIDVGVATFEALLNHVDSNSLSSIIQPMVKFVNTQSSAIANPSYCARLLFTAAGIKNTATDWETLLQSSCKVLSLISARKEDSTQAVTLAYTLFAYSDVKSLTAYHSKLLSVLTPQSLLPLSALLLERSPARFKDYVFHYLRKILNSEEFSEAIALMLLKFNPEQRELYSAQLEQVNAIKKVKKELSNYPHSNLQVVDLWWHLEVSFECPESVLLNILEFTLRNTLSTAPAMGGAIVGRTLELLRGVQLANAVKMCVDHAEILSKSTLFLSGLASSLSSISSTDSKLSGEEIESLFQIIIPTLLTDQGKGRMASLSILQRLYVIRDFSVPKLIADCIAIEELPYEMNSARNVQMKIRNLSTAFLNSSKDKTTDAIVLTYVFALTSVRFQPIWTSAIEAASKMLERDVDLSWNLVHRCLELKDCSSEDLNVAKELTSEPDHEFSDEEDMEADESALNLNTFSEPATKHLMNITTTVAAEVTEFKHPSESVVNFAESSLVPDRPGWSFRTQVLQVLQKAPRLAERHSVEMVSYLLADGETETWSHKDTVSLLTVFSLFKKPKSLDRADKVYDSYLNWLAYPDSNVQSVALKGVLSFGEPHLLKYKSNLNGLLDDKRFRDEVTDFLTEQEIDGAMHEGDKPYVLPIVVRILFGVMQSVSKTASGVKASKRFASISALQNFDSKYVDQFVDLATSYVDIEGEEDVALDSKHRNRVAGLLGSLVDMVRILKKSITCSFHKISRAIVYCIKVSSNDQYLSRVSMECLLSALKWMQGPWDSYYEEVFKLKIFKELNNGNWAADNLDKPSTLMKMFRLMFERKDIAHLLLINDALAVTNLMKCLEYDSVNDSVVDLIISSMESVFLELDGTSESKELIRIMAPRLLHRMAYFFVRHSSPDLLLKESNVLLYMAQADLVSDKYSQDLVAVCLEALKKNDRVVKVPVKLSIMQTLPNLLKGSSTEFLEIVWTEISHLFRTFEDKSARELLSSLYEYIGSRVPKLRRAAQLVADINAYDSRRSKMEQPDFDRRLAGYHNINENLKSSLSAQEWYPILHSALHFVHDVNELPLRINSSFSIRRFVESVKNSNDEARLQLLTSVLLPAVKAGLREEPLVRYEFIGILGHLVSNYSEFNDLVSLHNEDDPENDFFVNIVHVQELERQRALVMLGNLADKFDSNHLYEYLIPLAETYATDGDLTDGRQANIINAADGAVEKMTGFLMWDQFRAVTRRYIGRIKRKPEEIRTTVKLIGAISNSLQNVRVSADEAISRTAFIADDVVPTLKDVLTPRKALKSSVKPSDSQMEISLINRLPLALSIIKLMKCLPSEVLIVKLPGTLTEFCQILRSKSQELRDTLRKILGQIASILGSQYLIFLIKELRGALKRGAHLHILGFSIYSLLSELQAANQLEPGDLDDSAELIVDIIMEDTFGETGSDKEAEDYKSSMKEVKANKSYETAAMLSANVSLSNFNTLLEPIKNLLLYKKLSLNIEKKVQILLQRYTLGLNKNAHGANNMQVLIMCHQLYRQCSTSANQQPSENQNESDKAIGANQLDDDYYTIHLDSRNYKQKSIRHVENLHILQAFVLETIRSTLRKQKDLLKPENVAGFLPFLEEGVVSKSEDVQSASIRLATLICKLPIPEMKIELFVNAALDVVEGSSDTGSDLCQMCLKFLGTALYFHSGVNLVEKSVGFVLNKIRPDIEEPERQSVTFQFIKSVIKQKIIIVELYELMDSVAKNMITNPQPFIRDASRATYLQFLTEYPQGEKRLKKQLSFLISNLQYEFPAGRLSVMEALHLLLTRVDTATFANSLLSMFTSISLVLLNDEDPECKEFATMLVGEILDVSSSAQKAEIVNYCSKWLQSPQLSAAALQIYGVFFDRFGEEESLHETCVKRCIATLRQSSREIAMGEADWKPVYYALSFLRKIVDDGRGTLDDQEVVDAIVDNLLFPHAWVRLASARLVGEMFSSESKSLIKQEMAMQQVALRSVRQLGAKSIGEPLALQIVKNLVFIMKQWEQGSLSVWNLFKSGKAEQSEESEESVKVYATEWLLGRLSRMLREEKDAKEMLYSRIACVQVFATAIHVSSAKRLEQLGKTIILAFYEISTSEDNKNVEIKPLVEEALKMMQDKLGVTAYVEIYNAIRRVADAKKEERRAAKALLAVNDPAAFAQKKIKKHQHDREKRKRTIKEGLYKAKKRTKR